MSHVHTRNTCPDCKGTSTCRCMATKTETSELCPTCAKKSPIKEDAAAGSTGAASVAGVRGLLFKGAKNLTRKVDPKIDPKKIPVIKYANKLPESARHSFSEFMAFVAESEDQFDSVDVISKLSQNSKIVDDLEGDQLAVFGMESDDGAITKVYVPHEQAKDFERALGDRLKETKDKTGGDEIAAILFDLKDRFKIVDVKWPTIQEDEEQAPAPAADPSAAAPGTDPAVAATDPAAADPMAPPTDGTDPADPSLGADGAAPADSADMITQILDMLRQDAEARKADAEAKIADARAREADAAQRTAAVKLQGEEEVMDAEAYFKDKKEEKKEAERLKMIARFRQETKMDQDSAQPVAPSAAPQDADGGGDEDEEAVTLTRKTLLHILRGGR